MSRRTEPLSDAQWQKISPLLPVVETPRRRGRPRADDRVVVEGRDSPVVLNGHR